MGLQVLENLLRWFGLADDKIEAIRQSIIGKLGIVLKIFLVMLGIFWDLEIKGKGNKKKI